ncbi:hypothetical protein PS918_05336 [Pseudomonas fluorescens]|uniref:PAAR domain-containing protein n=1 Tax=Pseudomonas fluorescens TaxID=294 RepID=A0A5E7ULS1_PSEFL|nr:PAAR domain-containing protein [Pseudomonas fluorescens]VVQ11345.1 hypothetical protein PS918_05336 [Pseudomonas fluorescens]
MAKGHFIRLGDKTTCGGEVKEADTRVMMFGFAHARVGDRVTCGKDHKSYVIEGGVSYINSHGRLVAGSLDSVSSCPCKAGLIPTLFTASYESSRSTNCRLGVAGLQYRCCGCGLFFCELYWGRCW